MRRPRLALSCALLAPLALVALAALAGEPEWHEVLRVIDGDTIEIDLGGKATKVRLIGVDTPETVHPSKPVERFGREASAFTKELLEGRRVTLEYDQQRTDRYGRTLAYVHYRHGKEVRCANLEIVRRGYGFAYTKYPFAQEKMEAARAAEKEAREHKRGLWAEGDARAQPAKETPKKGQEAGDDTKVYVTTSGKKYHLEGCRSLSKSKIETTLAEARKGHGPCAICRPPE